MGGGWVELIEDVDIKMWLNGEEEEGGEWRVSEHKAWRAKMKKLETRGNRRGQAEEEGKRVRKRQVVRSSYVIMP